MKMKNYCKIIASILLASGAIAGASEPVSVKNFSYPGGKPQAVSEMFALDATQAYKLTGEIKGSGSCQIYLNMYDAQKRPIRPFSVNANAGTETVLTAPAARGSKSLTVADAHHWQPPVVGKIIVFNAKKDLSDLPNHDIQYYFTGKVKNSDGTYTVNLNRPLSKSYPAGTVIRQHGDGGNMNFGMNSILATKEFAPFQAVVLAAEKSGAKPNRIWRNTAFGRIYINGAQAVELRNLKLEPMSKEEAYNYAQKRLLINRELTGTVQVFNAAKKFNVPNELVIKTGSKKGGFYAMNLNADTAGIGQIEFTVKSDTPGYFKFAYVTMKDGKRVTGASQLRPHSVIPDGKYHTIIFDLSKEPAWQGTLRNWELSWIGEPATIGLRRVEQTVSNKIPTAAAIKANQKFFFDTLPPHAHCRWTYSGKQAPAMRLEFYDGDLNLLPGSIEFPAGGKNVDFTTPETVVRAKILIKSPGDGFPVIQVKEYRHPFASAFKWRGQWLWSQREWGPFYARVWFEKKFELKSAPEAALMAMVADDSADVFINGKFAGHAHPFWIPGKFDITKLLRPGKNTMTVRVYNGSQNAGVVVNCYIKTADSELYIDTDQSWKCEAKSNSQTIPSVIDQPVVELGDPNITMPWANRLGFRYAGEQGLLRRIDSKPGKLTVKIEKMPPCKVERLDFILRDEKNRQWKRQFAITPDSSQWKAGEVVTLSYPIPYINNGKYDLLLNDDYVYLLGDKKLYTFEQAPRPATQLAKAEFINRSTRPRLVMDGRTLNPAFWNSGTALGRDRFFELYLANEMGFDNFRVGTDFLKFWKGPGKYDFSDLDNSISYILTLNPNAVFTIHMHTHMPDWWLKLNPDDTSKCFNNQPRQRDRDKQALASKKWLRDADEPIKALVDFIKKQPYANRIWSVTIAENGNGEWFWWYKDDLRRPACSGFSAADHATFRMHLKRKYPNDQALQKAWKQPNVTLDTAMMPDPAKARKGRVGWLLDPAQDRQVMDWFEFRNLALAEALIELGGSVKRHTGGKWLVGAYYGYFTELIENGGLPLQITGHNGFYEVAKSPNVDFLFGPSRYTYRKTGMPDGLMHAWSTHQLNDKTMLCEQDMRTVYSNPSSAHDKMYVGTPDSSLESVGHINRAFGMMLATGTVNYWYDISGASFYERPFSQAIGKHNKVYKSLPDVKGLTPIETAVVCDRDSVYYTPNANISNVFSSAISGLFQHINKLAIPFRSLVVADLLDKNITVPAHKVYIMLPTLVLSQDQRAQLMQRFEREKATVIWLYAAGAFYPQAGPKAEYCGDFLQMKFKMIDKQFAPAMKAGNIECSNLHASSPWFYPVSGFDAVLGKDAQGQPMLVKKSLNGATHYFSTLMNLPVELYQDWLQAAGVCRYIKSIDDPVWAGNDVVFLYAKCPGRKIFDLPAGVRARGIIGPVKSTFSSGEGFEAQAGLTYGFLLER